MKSKDCQAGLVTVVIVNYNRCDDLREALLSVKEQDYAEKELIVIDNASQDNSVEMLRKEFPEVSVIALRENVGMDGYSVGFRHAKGEFIFQMDNDSLMPDKTVLSEVVKRFKEGVEELAVVSTRVEEYNPDIDNINVLRNRDSRSGPINTGGFHSGGVGFRKSLLDEVGYYNRDIFLYASELFLQMKFLAAGYKVFYFPEILVLHKSSPIARSSLRLYYELRNRYWFMRTFATPIQQLRYFPCMLFHDIIYALYKREFFALLRSLGDGFGSLPDSLREPLRSSRSDFMNKVNEVGANFSLHVLLKRVRNRIMEQ